MQADWRQHFRADEGSFIDQVEDWLGQTVTEYRPVLTDFTNPRERYIAQTIVNRSDEVKLAHWGGFAHAEMQRLLLYPAYFTPTAADFQLTLFEINYPTKFLEIHHRQVMGTLLGEGLARAAFGDILIDQGRCQVVVKAELAPFIQKEVTRVGKAKVKFVPTDLEEVVHPEDEAEPLATTVASLRLDTVVAAGFNYSRNRVKQLIERGLVRVNWQEIDRPDYELAVNDLLSVRHAGRIKLVAVGDRTRKDKLRVDLEIVKA